jgi:NAD(P)H-hydrate repair Nnr-like enzyme with NAD(P)H-hydrate dehydratase domain
LVLVTDDPSFRRLFPNAMGSKVERARSAAGSGATIVVLGDDPVVAAPDGRVAVAANGVPRRSNPAASDRVAACIGSLMGHGMPAFEIAAAVVWAHGDIEGARANLEMTLRGILS